MTIKSHYLLGGAALLMLTLSSAHAATVNVSDSPGSLFTTDALTGFTTDGSQMDGMEVSVCFSTGSCETVTWATTGPSTGAATGSGWSLSVDGDTFNTPFTFNKDRDGTEITSFSVNGRPGNTVFDILGGSTFSPGSALGRPFTLSGSTGALDASGIETINVEYTDELAIQGTFYGDLFTVMNVDFNDETFAGGAFQFISDTDNNDFEGGSPIVPVDPSPVPIPGTLMLLGSGLLGLLAFRRRSNR